MPFSFPASPSVGDTSTQNGRTYSWSGYAWEIVATPAALSASVITSGTLDIARIPTGTSSSTVCVGNDSRLSDSRTPTDGSVTTAKLADDAVTYAKLQNVSATDRLLGRSSAGAGDVEEITCTSFGRSLIDDADAAAARTTLSVQPTASPAFTGTATFAGQVLVTAGSGSSGSYKPGLAISGDDDTGVQQVGGANTLSVVTGGTERVRVDASGNVGIGCTPAALLDLGSSGGVKAFTYKSSNANAGIGTDLTGASYECSIFAGGTADTHGRISFGRRRVDTGTYTERMSIDSAGTVVAPQVYADTVGATNRDLFVDSTGKLGYVSSIRESKTDIVTLDDVSWLSALSPVSYRYRKRNADGTYSDEADGVTDYGLIAEDVEAVRPELCFYDDVDGEPQLRGVTYSKLITPMLRYIQQLEQRIAALEERING
jgi:hypothetical protein